MNTYQIRYFLGVCDKMSFSKASESLCITQQGLSKAIHALEEELQVTLFERNSNHLQLTKYGELARLELEKVDSGLLHLSAEINKLQREEKCIVNISILNGFFNDAAFDLSSLLGKFPSDINIKFLQGNTKYCESLLEKGDADICITKSPVNTEKFDICYRAIEPFYAIVPADDPLANGDILHLKDLTNRPVIILNEQYKFYNNFINRCKANGFHPIIHNTVSEVSALFLPCIMGKGIGVAPFFAVHHVNLPEIRIIPFSQEMSEEICILTNRNTTPTTHVLHLLEYLKNDQNLF